MIRSSKEKVKKFNLNQAELPVSDDDDWEEVGGRADQDDGEQHEPLTPIFEPRKTHFSANNLNFNFHKFFESHTLKFVWYSTFVTFNCM